MHNIDYNYSERSPGRTDSFWEMRQRLASIAVIEFCGELGGARTTFFLRPRRARLLIINLLFQHCRMHIYFHGSCNQSQSLISLQIWPRQVIRSLLRLLH